MTKKSKDRKNEIMDTAEVLFSKKGYANATINDILDVMGISKGAFYHYFKSKEEVMNEIVTRFINLGVERVSQIADDSSIKAPEKIFQIIMSQNQNTPLKKSLIDQFHQVNNAEMHQKSLIETVKKLTPVIEEVIEQGIEEGYFKTPYPKETVEFMLVSSQFLFDDGLFPWEPQELMKKAKAFSYIAETLLGAKEGSFSYIGDLNNK